MVSRREEQKQQNLADVAESENENWFRNKSCGESVGQDIGYNKESLTCRVGVVAKCASKNGDSCANAERRIKCRIHAKQSGL